MSWSIYIKSEDLSEDQKKKLKDMLFENKIQHIVLLDEGKTLRSYLEGGSPKDPEKRSKPLEECWKE